MGRSRLAQRIGNALAQVSEALKTTSVYKRVENFISAPTRRTFERLKNEMISEFRQLPVIEALEYGPGFGSNDFAGILGGKGDLFSFLGFRRNVKPTNALYAVLKQMQLERIPGLRSRSQIGWTVKNFPSVKDFEDVTRDQLEWADGFSWVTGLEKGVPGLGNYINYPFGPEKNSRSHFGLQKERGFNSTSRPIQWITPFLNSWFKRFEEAGFEVLRRI